MHAADMPEQVDTDQAVRPESSHRLRRGLPEQQRQCTRTGHASNVKPARCDMEGFFPPGCPEKASAVMELLGGCPLANLERLARQNCSGQEAQNFGPAIAAAKQLQAYARSPASGLVHDMFRCVENQSCADQSVLFSISFIFG